VEPAINPDASQVAERGLSSAEAAAEFGDQDDRGLGHRLHLRPGTAKRRRQRAVRHLAVVLATGQPPRRRRWFRRPVGRSERACKRTAAARQRPSLAALA
jgi:hypothetical protein